MKKEFLYIHFRQVCYFNFKRSIFLWWNAQPMEYAGVVFPSFWIVIAKIFKVIRVVDCRELKVFISFEQNDLDHPSDDGP